jgi:hypothetical protein
MYCCTYYCWKEPVAKKPLNPKEPPVNTAATERRRESYIQNDNYKGKNVMIATLDNEDTRDKFSTFAEEHHISESEKFIWNVQNYRILYYNKSDKWRKNTSERIIKTFILPGSELEINISHLQREAIINSKVVSVDIFDEVFNEIVNIIYSGSWNRFIEENDNSKSRHIFEKFIVYIKKSYMKFDLIGTTKTSSFVSNDSLITTPESKTQSLG